MPVTTASKVKKFSSTDHQGVADVGFAFETLTSDPTAPQDGRVYFNSTSGRLRQYTAAQGWANLTFPVQTLFSTWTTSTEGYYLYSSGLSWRCVKKTLPTATAVGAWSETTNSSNPSVSVANVQANVASLTGWV